MSNKSHNLTLALLQEITIKNLKNCAINHKILRDNNI